MLNAGGPQAGQHGDSRAVISLGGWTQSFARTRVRPKRVGTMARGGLIVKRARVRTPRRAAPAPPAPPGHQSQRPAPPTARSEEHTSELQSRLHLVCRLLLEKKKQLQHTSVPQPADT